MLRSLLLLSMAACAAGQKMPAPSGNSGFDLKQLDPTADPCVDFYQYACGGWRAAHPIPSDKSRWGRYDEMAQQNREKLRAVLEQAAAAPANPLEKQVGDYYAACMDLPALEKLGAGPISAQLSAIDAVKTLPELIRAVAALHKIGEPALFELQSLPDYHDSTRMIAGMDQGGLSLPDRDYYLKTDARTTDQRQHYQEHVTRMFGLLGEPADTAAADARTVLAVETELARASMDRTLRRDPKNLDHKLALAELEKQAPSFTLGEYLEAMDAPQFDSLNVGNPAFFTGVDKALASLPLDQWKTYLRWKVLRNAAPRLSQAFVDESWKFNFEFLRGTKAQEPRWVTCVKAVDGSLGEASGKLFVEHYFGPEGKEKIRQMVQNVLGALEESIRTVSWMKEETRAKALQKLKTIRTLKLGFPDKFRDYSKVAVARADFYGSFLRAESFEARRQLEKVGKPVDLTEWDMTPPTVNAYYNPQFNEIVFPAGMLQPPMFGVQSDAAYNYGAVGRVMGHELTHGFDDEGRHYDAQGNLTDWWQPEDSKAFEERASCIEKQYAGYSPVNDDKTGQPMYLNGKLTLGENTADNGGVRMALAAYLKSKPAAEKVDGFTPEQRFFLGYAVSRCENVTDQTARVLVITDPHSPGKYRLIGAVTNMPEFWQAFGCKQGQPMVRENACRVW